MRKGFTLLEVAIAMAILIVALAALLGHQGIAVQMSDFSNRLSQATLLLQGKMLDVEYKLIKDGMDQLDECAEGDFREEGFKQFTWKACGVKLDMADGAADQIVEQVKQMLAGFTPLSAGQDGKGAAAAPAEGDAPSPMDAMSGSIEMIASVLPTFLQQLQDKIRKVRVEVSWKDAVAERSVVIERFVTVLGEDRTEKYEKTDPNDVVNDAVNQAIGEHL